MLCTVFPPAAGAMNQASDQEPLAPQFIGGGPVVIVKNTFLDFFEAPCGLPQRVRSRSCPAAPPTGPGAAESLSGTLPVLLTGATRRAAAPKASEAWQDAWMVAWKPPQLSFPPRPRADDAEEEAASTRAPSTTATSRKDDEDLEVPEDRTLEVTVLSDGADAAVPGGSYHCGVFSVSWAVDAARLTSNTKQAVSPPFELPLGPCLPSLPCRLMVKPPPASASGRGAATFRRARGKGLVQLKCEAELDGVALCLAFHIAVGGAAPRLGAHHFAEGAVCGLPRELQEWDLRGAVDPASQTFTVSLKLSPSVRLER